MLFENVIDKVLVGRSLSSLHVLALAMLALAIAEQHTAIYAIPYLAILQAK